MLNLFNGQTGILLYAYVNNNNKREKLEDWYKTKKKSF